MTMVSKPPRAAGVSGQPLTHGSLTAFVFAGGGSLGAVEVGMLRALVANDILPDLVIGSSVGAINGAHFASDPTTGGVERLAAIWRALRKHDVFPLTPLRALRALVSRRDSLVNPAALRALLSRHIPAHRLDQTAIPCRVVATELASGAEVVITTGNTIDALMASAAIPVLFPPVTLDGVQLMDGGVSNHTPISAAIALGAQRVVVLPTGFSCAAQSPAKGVVGTLLHTFALLIAKQIAADAERYRSRTQLVIVPPLCPMHTTSYDFSRAEELIDRADAQTREWLARGGFSRDDIPPTLRPHTHLAGHESRIVPVPEVTLSHNA